jgi:hypothetical protein
MLALEVCGAGMEDHDFPKSGGLEAGVSAEEGLQVQGAHGTTGEAAELPMGPDAGLHKRHPSRRRYRSKPGRGAGLPP